MRDGEERDILIFSNDEMIGRLLDRLFVSQGFSSSWGRHSDETIMISGSLKSAPKIAIFDLPNYLSNKEKICQSSESPSGMDDAFRIVLSTQELDCSACSFHRTGKCENLRKPFITGELVGKVREVLS